MKKVLVIDDSALMRRVMSDIISNTNELLGVVRYLSLNLIIFIISYHLGNVKKRVLLWFA